MLERLHGMIVFIILFFMTAFSVFGYATLTDNLSITGSADVAGRPFKGVYIKEIVVMNAANISSTECEYILPTNHSSVVEVRRANGSITYKITVHNNTDVTYWYIGQRLEGDFGQNAFVGRSNGINISTKDQLNDNYGSFNSDDWIPAQTERDFYVTYTYGSDAPVISSTLINFHFDNHMDAVHDEFLTVLNNTKSNGDYEYLTSVFDEEYASNGSVSISTESHPEVFDKLFDDIMIDIDGEERKASVVIRRENLDNDTSSGDNYAGNGPAGCEYTLYITVESLTPGESATVYAIAYSEGADGMGSAWYQVGELYEGTAQIDQNGEIDYTTWEAAYKEYEIADRSER